MIPKSQPTKTNPRFKVTRIGLVSLIVMIICLGIILTTGDISTLPGFEIIANHRNIIVDGELAIFAIILVEFIGRAVIIAFRNRGMEPVGHNIRAVIRGVVYISLTIGIVSSLSSNPGLALSIGTITGVIVAFATQNLFGNIVAGIMLAIIRPVRVGDEVTVLSSTGRVKEIELLYTILDAGENWYYVPSMVMFSNVVMKKKTPTDRII